MYIYQPNSTYSAIIKIICSYIRSVSLSLYSLLCRYGIFSRAAINATIFTAFTHGMILVKSVIFSYAIIFISSRLMSHDSAQLSYPPTKLIEKQIAKENKMYYYLITTPFPICLHRMFYDDYNQDQLQIPVAKYRVFLEVNINFASFVNL